MFNIGPVELVVLAIVGLIVLGPDRLPDLARDAARMLRQLREMATGARQQLRDELGPEFEDVDLRNLNPRTAVRRAVFGDDDLPDLRKYDPRRYNASAVMRDAILGEDEDASEKPVSMDKPGPRQTPVSMDKPVATDRPVPTQPPATNGARPRPRPRPGPGRNFDDVT